MHRRQPRNPVQHVFRKAWSHTQHAGRQIDNFMRQNGKSIKLLSQNIAPLLAVAAPGAAAVVATFGAGAHSYSQLRDALDRAA